MNSGRKESKGNRRMPETASEKPRVAVIGLGSMGFGMATSLRRAGFDVTGCDVSEDAVARFVADGGAGAKTPAEAARQADIVVSVVVNAAQTETILFGAGRRRRNAGQGCGVRLLRDHGPGCRAAAGQTAGSQRPALSRRADLGRRAARGAGRTHHSRLGQSRPPSPRRGRRSTPWRQSSTNSAMPQARARRSR